MIPNDRAFNGKYFFEFDGKIFYRYQRIEKAGKYRLKIKLVSKNTPYKQGIAISFSTEPTFRGIILINGVPLLPVKKKHFAHVISEELFDCNELEIEILIEEGFLLFCNASDISEDYQEIFSKIQKIVNNPLERVNRENFTSGFSAGNLYGNAFWIENITKNKYRFYCNDHRMDDDFDDLIFDLEVKYSQ